MNIDKVNILGQDYTVVVKKNEDYGNILFHEKKIVINESDDHDKERTLLHEIIHGILEESGHRYNFEQHEEGLVRALENGLWRANYRRRGSVDESGAEQDIQDCDVHEREAD